ncbi:MAG: helix-turn-helix transcriptional regulator [Candidatus Paracaedimonas acanthamoebae]|uniref:Helix-turn-helix transcriptional regulator n=1 Tax=Candidatus Paracaedimonas acanthamoebae TaxID=244581 RepID=A0A8J7TVK8_9PROT|nr:helix-turn-helix transcriptional regulator [Candidatus Paracaedimonas acanthamoebae]
MLLYTDVLETKNAVVNVSHNKKITLSKRQTQCLQLLMRGKTSKEIGKDLSISYRTVEYYFDILREKFHCQNRREIIDFVLKSDTHIFDDQGI